MTRAKTEPKEAEERARELAELDRWDDEPRTPPLSQRELRTQLAAEGVELADMFEVAFRDTIVQGAPPRRPKLVGSTGMSTGGGRQARQNITLVPIEGRTGVPVVVGWADPATDAAELRSWRSVVDTFHERSGGRELALDNTSYTAFVRKVMAFLEVAGYRCSVTGRRAMVPALGSWGDVDAKRLVVLLVAVLLFGLALGGAMVLLMGR